MDMIEKLKALPGKISLWYEDLVTGERMALNEDVPMVAASVIKLFVLVEAQRRIHGGSLARDQEVVIRRERCVPSCGALSYMHDGLKVTAEDLYTLMTVLSDNTATNYLIDILGLEAIRDCIRDLGFRGTRLNRKMFDARLDALGVQNYITAREVGELLARLYRGTVISPEASRDMLRILKLQQINHKIPFYLGGLAEVAHKTGEDVGITHDAAIVFARRPFVLVVCGNGTDVPACERMMGEMGRDLYLASEGCPK
jgi:beta-lactamase class A